MPRRLAIRAAAVALGAWLALAACGTTGASDGAAADPSGLATVRLALDGQALPSGLAEVELRLTRPDAEPRVVRERVTGVGVLLWLSGLAPGTWLASVEGFDSAGATLLCGYGVAELRPGTTESVRIPLVAAARCEAHEDDCSDGTDDDVDGATDCADGDCEGLFCGPPVDCGPAATCGGGVCLPGAPGDCDDDDPCTVDACEMERVCVHTPLPCDDDDACTADACDPIRGCVHPPAPCDDDDACTSDTCDAASGCAHDALPCDDGDPCTTNGCDAATGCTYTPIAGCATDCGPVAGGCPSGFSCTDDVCRSAADTLYVPGGTFVMGCDPADPDDFLCTVYTWEQPPHTVTVSPFAIDRTEVRRRDYAACVTAGACAAFGAAPFCGGTAEHPVNCAAWQDAADYCAFAGARLCTEAEWEYAARGTDGRLRPWGDEAADCTRAHLAAESAPNHGCGTGATAAVGSYPAGAGPFGALDLVGNVSEWTADWYGATYYAGSPSVDPTGPASGDRHVHRGGNYLQTDPFFARASDRGYGSDVDRDDGQDGLGIRCCHDLTPCAVLGDGAACDDDDPCTTGSTCGGGVCGGGTPLCDDGSPCTTDTCTAGSCGHVAAADGAPCDDGDPCWSGDTCLYGICLTGSVPLACADSDPCSVDTCLRGVGCEHHACPSGTACDASTCTALAGTVELVHVPGGAFWMGCNPTEEAPLCQLYADAALHGVTLSPFDVMAKEATVAQLIECNLAGPCASVTFCGGGNPINAYPNHPATCLNRSEAATFCAWGGMRLCTEAEWEKAVRGTDARTYPWGNTPPDCTVAVMNELGTPAGLGCGAGTIREVGTRPAGASPYGLLDGIGNAEEWVADGYDARYYTTGPAVDPPGPATTTPGVARGALWSSGLVNPQFLLGWYRESVDPVTGPFSVGRYGVRCCRDAVP